MTDNKQELSAVRHTQRVSEKNLNIPNRANTPHLSVVAETSGDDFHSGFWDGVCGACGAAGRCPLVSVRVCPVFAGLLCHSRSALQARTQTSSVFDAFSTRPLSPCCVWDVFSMHFPVVLDPDVSLIIVSCVKIILGGSSTNKSSPTIQQRQGHNHDPRWSKRATGERGLPMPAERFPARVLTLLFFKTSLLTFDEVSLRARP